MVVSKLAENASKTMFLEILIEGTTPTAPPTITNANNWIKALNVPFSTAIDATPSTFTTKKTYGVKETTYIVERTTMKIVAKAKTPEEGLTALSALPP